MGSWLLKTAIQRLIYTAPYSDHLNELLQRYVTRGLCLEPDGEFRSKVEACRKHLDCYRACSRSPRKDFSVVEIGTGWFPIIPIGLYLCGAKEIWTYDIVRLLRSDTLSKVLEYFCLFERNGDLFRLLPDAEPRRVAEFMKMASAVGRPSPVEFLSRLNIHSLIDDVRDTGLPSASVDLVFSHGVMEHFSPQSLAETMKELRRLCSEPSVMSHYLGIADQFASRDAAITPFNNMRFSARAWRWLDSPLIPQNRLRISDYVQAYAAAGFDVVAREDITGSENDLDSLRLAPEFRKYSKGDLLVLFSWLTGRPAAKAPFSAAQDDLRTRF